MVSATIHRPESEKPSVSGKSFSLLRLLSSESIDEISKGFVFSTPLVWSLCQFDSTLGTYRPRADRTSSDLLGLGVAVIAKIANDFVAWIADDYFMSHVFHAPF